VPLLKIKCKKDWRSQTSKFHFHMAYQKYYKNKNIKIMTQQTRERVENGVRL